MTALVSEPRLSRALGWILRLPLLGDPELSCLLGIDPVDARCLREQLGQRGWVEWITPRVAALNDRPLAFAREEAVPALAGWLGLPEIGCHLARTPRLAAAAELEVLVAPGPATRAFGHLAALAGAGERGEPLVCDLATIEPAACSLSLSIGKSASGSGAVAWQLATALFERAGITLQQTAASTTLLTLRRAGRATISI